MIKIGKVGNLKSDRVMNIIGPSKGRWKDEGDLQFFVFKKYIKEDMTVEPETE